MTDAEKTAQRDQARAAKALEEARRLTEEAEAKHVPDANEPREPHLKTGYGLTAS